MRRWLALCLATATWIIVVQLLSGAVAPARVYDLTDVGVRGLRIPTANMPAPAVVHKSIHQFSPRSSRVPLRDQVNSQAVAAPTTTSIAVATTTTSAPAPTTTATPTSTTSTTSPASTTTPPTTTSSTSTTAAATPNFGAAAETDFASRINALRASVGVPLLAGNADLNNYARWWARYMAESGNFTHSDIGLLLGEWSIVGENIGYGPAVQSIFNALVNSSGHYNNMVESRFTAVGVGVFVDDAGQLWTAHVFGG